MIKNYFKIAWRTLMHDKGFTALNVLSLTIGLTFSLLLFYYVQDELSFDDYHKQGDQIYRINSSLIEGEKTNNIAMSPLKMGLQLKLDYKEVENYTTFIPGDEQTPLTYEQNVGFIEKVYYADSNVFSIFDNLF